MPPSVARALLGLLAATVLAGAGCGDGEEPAAPSGRPVIYVSAPLLPPADRGRDVADAARLAVREAEGRAGRFEVDLRVHDESARDERWTPDRVAEVAREALQDDSVVAYIGGVDPGSAAVATPILNGGPVVVVSPAATYTGLTMAAGAGKGEPERFYPSGRRTFVRLVPADDRQAEAQALAQQRDGCRSLVLLHEGDAFNDSTARLVGQAAEARGIAVVEEERVRDEADVEDDRSLARDLAPLRPDCAFVAFSDAARAAALARALVAVLPSLGLYAPAVLDTEAFTGALGPAAGRTTLTRPAGGSPARAIVRRFAAAFEATYGREPGPWAAPAYEATKLVLWAIASAEARGDEREAVADAVLSARRRSTVLGEYAVTPAGDASVGGFEAVRLG
jgi:branched-chain amino acid transport system substrate-binding protein